MRFTYKGKTYRLRKWLETTLMIMLALTILLMSGLSECPNCHKVICKCDKQTKVVCTHKAQNDPITKEIAQKDKYIKQDKKSATNENSDTVQADENGYLPYEEYFYNDEYNHDNVDMVYDYEIIKDVYGL